METRVGVSGLQVFHVKQLVGCIRECVGGQMGTLQGPTLAPVVQHVVFIVSHRGSTWNLDLVQTPDQGRFCTGGVETEAFPWTTDLLRATKRALPATADGPEKRSHALRR